MSPNCCVGRWLAEPTPRRLRSCAGSATWMFRARCFLFQHLTCTTWSKFVYPHVTQVRSQEQIAGTRMSWNIWPSTRLLAHQTLHQLFGEIPSSLAFVSLICEIPTCTCTSVHFIYFITCSKLLNVISVVSLLISKHFFDVHQIGKILHCLTYIPCFTHDAVCPPFAQGFQVSTIESASFADWMQLASSCRLGACTPH